MKFPKILIALMMTTALTGCGGISESLGFGRNPPDEFAVVERPALALPPDFSLKPPEPGKARPQETSTEQKATAALFGGDAKLQTAKTEGASEVEVKLLQQAGADKITPNVRDVVDRETAERVVANQRLVDAILWWREPASNAVVVDPEAERARVKAAKEEGKSLNDGATPVIEKEKSGFLGL